MIKLQSMPLGCLSSSRRRKACKYTKVVNVAGSLIQGPAEYSRTAIRCDETLLGAVGELG